MRANSIIMVILALVFGIVAVVLANMWLTNQRNQFANASEGPQNTIVVAATALRFGEPLANDNIREIPWPADAVPQGAFRTRAELLSEDGQRQVLTAVSANEPILESKITGPGQRATLSAVLTEGMRAVSIRVNDVLGVAGFVLPGDRVDILLTRKVRDGGGDEQAFVDVLLQSIKVLAIDQLADENRNNPTVVKSVTLEVNTKDAQKLTLAAGIGQLSLALRQVASNEGENTDRITLADLTGETPADVAARQAELERQLAAEEARRLQAENALSEAMNRPVPEPEVREIVKMVQPAKPVRASINVYRGLDHEVYEVPRR